MYITIHEPNGTIHLESEAAFNEYKKDKIIVDAAGGLVFNEKNELLMIFRRGFWDLPKGKVDEGETIEACAKREVQEETGLQRINIESFLTTTYHTYLLKGKTIIKPSHWFKMKHSGAETLVPQTEEDITAIKFMNKEEAYKLLDNMYPTIKLVVEQYF
jgi:8-oxo-dGTP pyrophosphatase MutT (NUDIX family)